MTTVQTERTNVRLYKAIAVSCKEKRELAALWWGMRAQRTALDARYADIAASLVALPSAACAPCRLVERVFSLCVPGTASPSTSNDTRSLPASQQIWTPSVSASSGISSASCGRAESLASDRHSWARAVLGASAGATVAACAAHQALRAWSRAEVDTHNVLTGMAANAPCMAPATSALFFAEQFAHGACTGDILRMCELAAHELRRKALFPGTMPELS
jgi:hypothetical protein